MIDGSVQTDRPAVALYRHKSARSIIRNYDYRGRIHQSCRSVNCAARTRGATIASAALRFRDASVCCVMDRVGYQIASDYEQREERAEYS